MEFQQKQPKSDEDEFESPTHEVQTYLKAPTLSPYHKMNHPRTKAISEKHKLGLIVTPALTEPQYSTNPSRSSQAPHGKIIKIGSATFRSNYQSGSIGSVELVGNNSYRISLDLESNSGRGNTWFFFTVEGVKGEGHFVIKGFTKKSSLFNEGMKICYRDNKQGSNWRRGGTRISYEPFPVQEDQEKMFCLKFTFFFKTNQPSSIDFAYSFPYTFQRLTKLIPEIQNKVKTSILGCSFDGRNIPLFTTGNPNSTRFIVISARAHPGQTGSSFIVQGLLRQLTSQSQSSIFLRQNFLIKVVPMINVDGVCRGNFRFSAVGVDLNRKWKQPSEQYHPEVYYLKEMIRKQSKQRQLKMYIDFHGHSRKKNVFFYGCCPHSSSQEENAKAKIFPYLMSKIHTAFSYSDCSFSIQKDKEGTARVSLFKQFKIRQIFTCEASFCGPMGGHNFSQVQYQKIGRKICDGMTSYFATTQDKKFLSNQLLNLREQSLVELEDSPFLLKVGNGYDSGSDSQPEKGQLPQKKMKNVVSKSEQKKRSSKVQSTYYSKTPKINSSLKQKSQTTIGIFQDKSQVNNRDPYLYLLEAPTQLLDTDFKHQQQTLCRRVHSLSKQAHYQKFSRHGINHYQDQFHSLNPDKSQDKTKVNLMVGREGAQYRRVRKMAQQSIKHESSEIEVKGVKGSKIQMEVMNNNTKVSNFEKNKYRRTSAQMFFRKPTKTQQKIELSKNEINVLCRGKQIFF